jgi:hypothetical protein
MIYSIYNQTTGQILGIVQSDIIDKQLKIGENYIQGGYDFSKYYVENSLPVEIPPKLDSPYAEFDYTTKTWVLNSQLAVREVRIRRRQLLDNSDWTDLLSAKTRLGEEKYNQWQIYRQQLRDVTNQPGYPLTVTWPAAPGSTSTS